MDEYAGAGTRVDFHGMLPEPVLNELVIVCWCCHTACLQPSDLSAKLCCSWPLHFELHRMLSEVSTINIDHGWLLTRCSGYSFAEPTSTPFTDRPAFGGTCYTPLYEATPVIVTKYGESGVTETAAFTASVTNAQAYAYPIDGYAFGVAEVASITSAITSTASSTSSVPSTSTSSTAAATSTAVNSGSSSGTSTGVKVGASIGSIAGVAIILAGLFFLYRRYKKNAAPVPSPEDGNNYAPAMIGSSEGKWPAEIKPDIPPKGAELHDQSTPGELEDPGHPVELHDGSVYGTHDDPAEMWTPNTPPSHQPPGYNQVSPDEQSL